MQASAIFESWFEKYSQEDETKPGQRVMTPETAVEYVRICAREKPAGMNMGVSWQSTTEVRDANDHRV